MEARTDKRGSICLLTDQGVSTLQTASQQEQIAESAIDIKKELESWKLMRLGSISNEGSQCNETYKIDG